MKNLTPKDQALLAQTVGDLSDCMKAIVSLIDGGVPLTDILPALVELRAGLDTLLSVDMVGGSRSS